MGSKEHPKTVVVFTDGACSGNPGPGGWAATLQYGRHERVLTGSAPRTTNNRMELTAALEALRAIRVPCVVEIHTDSAYLANAFNQGWIDNWIRKGWKTAAKKPVENQDLWEQLLTEVGRHRVKWVKVKGHADNDANNRVDRLAVEAIKVKNSS
ncbi:MAG: ribonuclease HI [Rhodothermales bacterium]